MPEGNEIKKINKIDGFFNSKSLQYTDTFVFDECSVRCVLSQYSVGGEPKYEVKTDVETAAVLSASFTASVEIIVFVGTSVVADVEKRTRRPNPQEVNNHAKTPQNAGLLISLKFLIEAEKTYLTLPYRCAISSRTWATMDFHPFLSFVALMNCPLVMFPRVSLTNPSVYFIFGLPFPLVPSTIPDPPPFKQGAAPLDSATRCLFLPRVVWKFPENRGVSSLSAKNSGFFTTPSLN
ncbi:hypothetical protein E2C01_001364 [Portunus trituberculatus]|uniref:Uncharacterized protein n=1 Tax=Portunus trituberculatus TaxID=210409 RepID=A0A5B7CJ34_PORTR|nr:hypothetical protein [Portunus trituberculatus]